MHTPPISAFALACLLLAGCTSPDPFTAADDLRPQHDVGSGPGAPGASGVFRVQGVLAFFVVDPAHDLMTFHGIATPWSALCAGSPPAFDPVDVQLIFTPAGPAAGIFQGDEHTVWVYPAADIGFSAGPEDCAVMTSLPVLATGPASVVRTDNDFFGTGGPRRNAFGWEAHGVLDDLVNGGQVGYSETARFVIDQVDPPSEVAPVAVAIRLHP